MNLLVNDKLSERCWSGMCLGGEYCKELCCGVVRGCWFQYGGKVKFGTIHTQVTPLFSGGLFVAQRRKGRPVEARQGRNELQ